MAAMTSIAITSASAISPVVRPDWRPADTAFWQAMLGLPQLAVLAESCAAETRLHDRLVAAPTCAVGGAELAMIDDADARANYAHFLSFRDAVQAAGTLESYYLGLMRGAPIDVPPLFLDIVVSAIVERLGSGRTDAFEERAGQMLHRSQRIALSDGRVLAADRDVADAFADGGNAAAALPVLGADNAATFFAAADRRAFVLDLTHEVRNELGHGLAFTLTRAHSGQAALARVLERWITHFLGVETTISPVPRIDDPAWAWHIGLDAEASLLLDLLYAGQALEPAQLQRLIGLFRLDFADPREMRADLAGKPVYLALATSAEQAVKLKPQNLLLNLPLTAAV